MSMEPVLLGAAAAPVIASGANAAGRAASTFTQSFQSVLQSAGGLLTSEPAANASNPADEQSLAVDNPRFALLSNMLAGNTAAEATEPLSIADIQTHVEQLQTDVEQRIESVLADAGIRLDSPLQIALSGIDGSLEVVGAHPQRAAIEAALNSDPTLAADFQVLSAEQKLLEHYASSRTFAKEFASQPWQAIASRSGSGNERYQATLEVAEGSGQLRLQFE
jgi:hypothetical protein